ncbi:hypothetical protein Tco_1193678 [Tanacetum coccineum]
MPTDAGKERNMRTQLGKLFAGPTINKDERVYTVDSLEISRSDWYITGKTGGTTSNLRFAIMTISRGTVYCCHTAETFTRICSQLNLHNMPGEGFLIRAIYLSKRIYIMNPLKELAERKGNVLYLAGRLHKDDVFVRKVPVDDNCTKGKGSLLSYVNDLGEESDPKNRELVMLEVLRNVVLALL